MRGGRMMLSLGGVAVLVAGLMVPAAAEASGPSSGPTVAIAAAPHAEAAKPKVYKNCTELNKKYPHGVGKKGAKDKVSGKSKPVKNFKVDTALYNANKKSDRDKDGVACEKK